jgi:hypothetical protein
MEYIVTFSNREKWLSVLHHIINKHRWTGCTQFHKCDHKRLTAKQKKSTPWLDPKSAAFKALQEVVTATRLLNCLPNITMFCHTGELEVFHSMLLKYCPKRQHFHYPGRLHYPCTLNVQCLIHACEGYNLL